MPAAAVLMLVGVARSASGRFRALAERAQAGPGTELAWIPEVPPLGVPAALTLVSGVKKGFSTFNCVERFLRSSL